MVVGEFTQEANLVILGGGPAGYAAAFRAAELGVQDIVIVDPRQELGGVCLHAACVPSKTLCDLVATLRRTQGASAMGVSFSPPQIDGAKVSEWVGSVVAKLGKGLASRAKSLRIQHLPGTAHFEDGKHVAVSGGSVPRVKFRRAIIATGSRPVEHADLPFDGARILTPEQAVAVHAHGLEAHATQGGGGATIPKTLLVIGSDYIAVEIAWIFAGLGSKVTLASPGPTLLPGVDDDLLRPLRKSLESSLEILLGASIDAKAAAMFDRVVISLGRRANSDSLDLARAQVDCDGHGFIHIDDTMKTSNPRIFAAGDVTRGAMLADVALAQGRIAAEVIAGRSDSIFDHRAIPHAIFTDPNIAWCGLTETEAKKHAVDYAAARAPWGLSGRAVGMNAADGLTKIIYDKSSQVILGVGIVGRGACELIGEAALALEMGATLEDLAATMHPHPTMCELLADAARGRVDD